MIDFEKLKEDVAEELANAAENDYEFDGWTDEELAMDLDRYSAVVEGTPIELLIRAVHEVR